MRLVRAGWCLLVILGIGGCERVYDEYVPVAVEFLILEIDNPVGGEIDFDEQYADGRVEVRCYLSEATTLEQVGQTPAEGATVLLQGTNMGMRELIDRGGGLYGLDNQEDPDLRYGGHLTYDLTIHYAGKERLATIDLPEGPWVQVPDSHSAGAPMTLDLDPPDFDNAFSVVIGPDGQVTHTDQPPDLASLVPFLSVTDVGSIEIPASAFPTGAAHVAVAAGGVRVTRGEELVKNLDHEICRFGAGSAQLELVELQ
jgi:hypothetical protein